MKKLIQFYRFNLCTFLYVCVILQNKAYIKKKRNIKLLKNELSSADKDGVESLIPPPRKILLPVLLSLAKRKVVRIGI